MVDKKVMIGIITGNSIRRPDFYDYFHMLKKPDDAMLCFCHDRSPAKGRNEVIAAAREQECTHVLFIDDDNAVPADGLTKLLEHDLDIVSGLYLIGSYPHQPVIFDLADEETGACLFSYLMGDEPRLKPIVCAGFGFILIKMSVFDKLEKPYIRLGELDPENWCDDVGFFNRVRKAGITEIYCDTEVLVGHMKNMIVWPKKVDGKWYAGYDTNGIGMTVNIPLVVPNDVFAVKEESNGRNAGDSQPVSQ